jgi:hypothetical protein
MNAIVEARNLAARKLLLRVVRQCRWNLTRAAKRLRVLSSTDVIRYLRTLAPKEYQAARKAGLIRRGGNMRGRQ